MANPLHASTGPTSKDFRIGSYLPRKQEKTGVEANPTTLTRESQYHPHDSHPGNLLKNASSYQFPGADKRNRVEILKIRNNFVSKRPQSSRLKATDASLDSAQQAKKMLYVVNNEIKSQFNELALQNRQMETRVKQLTKEREQLEREVTPHYRPGELGENHSSLARVENELQLKARLKGRKEELEASKAELKGLKTLLRDENLTNLKNENISLINTLLELKNQYLSQKPVAEESGEGGVPAAQLTASNFLKCEKILAKETKKKAKLEVFLAERVAGEAIGVGRTRQRTAAGPPHHPGQADVPNPKGKRD